MENQRSEYCSLRDPATNLEFNFPNDGAKMKQRVTHCALDVIHSHASFIVTVVPHHRLGVGRQEGSFNLQTHTGSVSPRHSCPIKQKGFRPRDER